LIWKYYISGENNIYYKKSPDGGATWTTGQRLTWTGGSSESQACACDASDYLHLVWVEYAPGNAEIYYRKGN
jgi:hypothetical protein